MKRWNRLMYWFYELTWKKILVINMFLLILAVIPLSLNVALNRTQTRSEAALLPKPQPSMAAFETPTGPPQVYLVDHFFGKKGDAVLIHGKNLGGIHPKSWVALAGKRIATDNIVSWTGDYIEFKVPAEAISGQIEVSILGKRTAWPGTFFVVNEKTETELRLKGEKQEAYLSGKGLQEGRELLVWLLIISGGEQLKLTAVPGVLMTQSSKKLPIGQVYEVKLRLNDRQLTNQSALKFVDLLKVEKSVKQLIGIARGELTDQQGNLIPLQVHPLYVSF
jgi:hypothetical protein